MFNRLVLSGAIVLTIVAQVSAAGGTDDELPEELDWQDFLTVVGRKTGIRHLTAVKDVRCPEIIHIIDKDLLTLRNYGIGQRGDLDYLGTPDGLIQSINAEFSSVGSLLSEASQMPLEGDKATRIEVHPKSQQLRSILTDSIPLDNRRSRVLWYARTWMRNTGPKTSVRFK